MTKMISRVYWVLVYLALSFFSNSLNAQTLIINEVSQGIPLTGNGNREYVELLVVPGSNQSCSNSCLDLRGWIIDDNNGYFSNGPSPGEGIASGAVRFASSNPFWSCIPIGTIIVIYNSVDKNPAIPPDDIDMDDGNCTLIIPVTSNLLEAQTSLPDGGSNGNATTPPTPGDASYPTSGWGTSTSWGPLGMSNSDDSFQIYSPTNTIIPVSGVSWGGNNTNSIIYFSGSASGLVFSFTNNFGNNPNDQANWTSAQCSISDTQTPGAPNNALNASYINSLTNDCQTVSPLLLTSSSNSQSCNCDGTATVNASGSVAPYSYNWYNSFDVSLGQTTATATNLCTGNYYCVITTSIGCSDTISVFVGNTCSNFGTFASATMIQNCDTNQFYNTTWANLPDQINPNGVLYEAYNYGPFFQNSNTLILRGGEVKTYKNPGANVCGAKLHYTVYTVGNQPANPTFTILDLPFKESCNVGPNNFPTGGPCFNASDQKWAKEDYNIDLTVYPPGDYVLEVYYAVPGSFTSTTACNDTIYVNNSGNNYKALFQIKPQPLISAETLNICPGNTSTLTSNYTSGNTWSTSSTTQSIFVNTSGIFTLSVNLNNNCPNLSDNETVNVYAAPTVDAGVDQTTCSGSGAITLNGVIGGSATSLLWSSSSGTFSSNNSASTTYTPSISSGDEIIILTATGPCPSVQDQLTLSVIAAPTVDAGVDQTVCSGSAVNLSGTFGGSSNSISWTAPSGSFSNTASTNPIYTPSITAGSVTLTITAFGPCPSISDEIIISVSDPTIPAFSQIDPICLGGTFSFSSTSINGITGNWSPSVNNTATTLYVFTPTAGQCASSATMTVIVNSPTTPNFNQIAPICTGETFILPTSSLNGITGNWFPAINSFSSTSYTFTPDAGQCAANTTMTVSVLPTYSSTLDSTICENDLPLTWNGLTFNAAGTQSLTSTALNGCDSSIIMNVQVLALPQVSITGGGVFCEGDAIQPVSINIVGSTPYNLSYTLNGLGTNVNSNQPTITIGNNPGTYVLTEVSDQNCKVNSNLGSASIVINPIPISPQVSNDSIYCLNYTPDTLFAIGNLNAAISWYDQPELQNSIQSGNYYIPDNILGSTTYYVVQEENGCLSTPNNVTITFENCVLIIPTAFTPDEDNVNDIWILDGIDVLFPKNTVNIYNRWGNLIYQSEQGKYETNAWSGKYNDKSMPVGSYYFIIEFNDGQTENKTGIVSIIK